MKSVALAEVAAINPRGEALASETPVSFVGMAELDAETATARPRATRTFGEVSTGYTIFRDYDILAAKITPCWENGKVGQAHLDHPIGVGSTEFHVLRPGANLDDRYLMHFLRLPTIRVAGELRMTGSAGQKRVPVAFLQNLSIPQTSLAEQPRDAAILDRADALRAKRRQVLAHFERLSDAVFYELFGDPLSNSFGLPQASIGSVAEVVTGNSPPRADVGNFGSAVEWIKSDNLGGEIASTAGEWLSETGRKKARVAPPGSILVTCIAGSPKSIGKASLVDRAVAFNQQINAIIPSNQLVPDFLLRQLKVAPDLVRMKSTGGMKGLVSKSSFERIEILVPPMDLQHNLVGRTDRINQLRSAVESGVAADDEFFASLQSRAFRGEL